MKRFHDLNARTMLFAGQATLGAIFTLNPIRLFVIASSLGILLLIVPAHLINVWTIPTNIRDYGFGESYNWSITYTLIAPLALAMSSCLMCAMGKCANEMWQEGRIVSIQKDATSYPIALARRIKSHTKQLIVIVFLLTIAFLVFDTIALWWSLWHRHLYASLFGCFEREPGWDTASISASWKRLSNPGYSRVIPYPSYRPCSLGANILFDVIAYSFEATVIFLELILVLKISHYLFAFSDLIGGNDGKYSFTPDPRDLHNRLGLKSMSGLFDSFLLLTALIAFFAFYHRLYLIMMHRSEDLHTYLVELWSGVFAEKGDSNELVSLYNSICSIVKIKNWGFDSLDVSQILTILLVSLPVLLVCYLPLYRIRKVADEARISALDKLNTERAEARAVGNDNRVLVIEKDVKLLEKANVWPCGNARARIYLLIIASFYLGAIGPPIFVLMVLVTTSDTISQCLKRFGGNVG